MSLLLRWTPPAVATAATAAFLACAPAGAAPPAAPAPQTAAPVAAPAVVDTPAISTRRLSFAEVVDSIASTPPLDRTHWGILLYDPVENRALFERNAGKNFISASNMKIATAAAALAILGPEYRFRTPVYAAGGTPEQPDRLVVVGRGDPSLSARFYETDYAALDTLAARIAESGVRRVRGDLVIDASFFAGDSVVGSWEGGDLDWYYAAPAAALGVAEAAIEVVIRPGSAPGRPASIDLRTPAGLVEIENRLVTVAGGRPDVGVVRGRDTLIFHGTVPLGWPPDREWVAAPDPAYTVGRALQLALEARGIDVGGSVRVVRDAAEAAALAPARRPIAGLESPPLADVLAAVLGPSQSWVAGQVLLAIGSAARDTGSFQAGLAAVEQFLSEDVGLDPDAVYIVDASGLSVQNLLTPWAVVRLLTYAETAPWSDAFRAALAVPAEPTTTLEDRLLTYAGRVWAKTGTLTHVNALSGYVTTADGRELVFSIMSMASGAPTSVVRAALDRMVEAIAEEE